MPNRVQTYVLPDSIEPGARSGVYRVNRKDAMEWNNKGYGVFHTVQEFYGPRRLPNLVHINAWAIDMDDGSKSDMMDRIKLGLIPTLIVETKRGFHVYWKAKDATVRNWKQIMSHRLVPFYKADKRAKDLCRILRTPGYYHRKDPTDPFLIKKLCENPVEYTEKDMFHFYSDLITKKTQKALHAKAMKETPGHGEFWDLVWNLNCEVALTRLSGSEHVGGEVYTFQDNFSGTKNIIVNGKGSSCWIDADGRIGSADGGGPSIFQWLNWFHKNPARVIEVIKKEFPECNSTQMSLI